MESRYSFSFYKYVRFTLMAVISLPALLSLTGCLDLGRSFSDKEAIVTVANYKSPCSESSNQLCWLTKENDEDDFKVKDIEILGLDYQWGQQYRIRATERFDNQGRTIEYDVLEVIETITTPNFIYAEVLDLGTGVLAKTTSDEYLYGNEKSVLCLTDCSSLNEAINNVFFAQLEFTIDKNVVNVRRLICSAMEDNFDEECEGISTEQMIVSSVKSECGLIEADLCHLYKINSSDEYELLPLDIESYEYNWGFESTLEVEVDISPGGKIEKVSLLTDDSAPVDQRNSIDTFNIILRGSEMSRSVDGIVPVYDEAPALDCGTEDLCVGLDSATNNNEWLLLEVIHEINDSESNSDVNAVSQSSRLQLVDIICRDADLSIFRDCVAEITDVTWQI